MSKRLLRYALSRLEFLDTDALDVDKLDLEWGRNNVLTFQDVGIKLEACQPTFIPLVLYFVMETYVPYTNTALCTETRTFTPAPSIVQATES